MYGNEQKRVGAWRMMPCELIRQQERRNMSLPQGINLSALQSAALHLAPVSNQLLEQLPYMQKEEALAACELVDLSFGEILCESGQSYTHVYFPLTAFVSLVGGVSGHPPLDMDLIGSEGMLGSTLVMGVKIAPMQAIVQGPGTALRMSLGKMVGVMRANTALAGLMGRYLHVLVVQLAQTIACTRFHSVEARLVRWLLMTHDRAHADHFHLTHQFLADMLGVQRSAVTIAAGNLQEQGLISYSRGAITILDREGLQRASCECYEAGVAVYRRLLDEQG
jgi:CRP-like cAMP-binding protein